MKLLGIGDKIVDPEVAANLKPLRFKSAEGVVRNVVNMKGTGPGVVVRYEMEPGQGKSGVTDVLYTLPQAEALQRL